MAVFCGAFPVLPGKLDAMRAFADETTGAKLEGFEDAQARVGSTRETWSIQELPDGSAIVLVWVETRDVADVFADLAQDDSEWTRWFRSRVLDITGVDLTRSPGRCPRSDSRLERMTFVTFSAVADSERTLEADSRQICRTGDRRRSGRSSPSKSGTALVNGIDRSADQAQVDSCTR